MKVAVIIFSSGNGTRLRPHTLSTPKPLLPLENDGSCMLDYSVRELMRQGFVDIFINYSYGLNLFEDVIKRYHQEANITLLDDLSVLGQGGIILKYSSSFKDYDYLLCLNGDTFVDTNLTNFVERGSFEKCLILSDSSIEKAKSYLLIDDCNRVIGYQSPTRGDYYFYPGVSKNDLFGKVNYLGVSLIPVKTLSNVLLDTGFMGLFGRDDLFERFFVRGVSTYPSRDVNIRKFLSMDTCEEYERILEDNGCTRPILHPKIK